LDFAGDFGEEDVDGEVEQGDGDVHGGWRGWCLRSPR
jgi:hypothetical protein